MAVLITGGAGFIGSHTVVELLALGHDLVIFDNLANASIKVLDRIEQITGKRPRFVKGDICNVEQFNNVFEQYSISSVVHFAGLKAVGESSQIPLAYYHNNVTGSINLFQAMLRHQVYNVVFSSSATVHGEHNQSPLIETMPTSATNPYGQNKLMVEHILQDLCASEPKFNAICLRYFNPIGAHASGLIGESPNGIPNNLLPYVAQVAVGKLPQVSVFGDDYDTIDGTGVRDYIHVVDLAKGHVKALDNIGKLTGFQAINLGTGQGTSVLQIIEKFKQVSGQAIPYQIVDRRTGDLATVFADASQAKQLLGWQAELDLNDMIVDAWRWQSENPNGLTD